MKKSLEKLSSGYRINRAGDDAAGLAISEGMRAQIRGLDQAMRNVNDGISLTQTGDGCLTEIHAMLGRLKTLAVQSANGTYNTIARSNLDLERKELLSEIDRIGENTDFNDIMLFDSPVDPIEPIVPPLEASKMRTDEISLQIGTHAEEILNVQRYKVNSETLLLGDDGKGGSWTDFSTQEAANASIPFIENAIEAIADVRAEFGAAHNHLEHTYSNLSVTSENVTTSESRIRDTDMADEFTSFTRDNIMFQASNSMVAQANAVPQMVLNLLQ